jgi:hypothetical protein
VPLLFLFGERLLGFRQGLLGAALLTVAPLHIHYSREARTYALALFFLLLSSLAALYVVDTDWPVAWAAYGALAAFVPALHLLAGFALLPQLVWVGARAVSRRGVLLALATAAVVVSLLVPLGLLRSVVTAHQQSGLAFVHPTGETAAFARPASAGNLASGMAATLTRFLGIEYFALGLHGRQIFWLAVPFAALAVAAAWRPPSKRGQLFLIGGSLLPLGLVVALTIGYGHLVPLQDRYAFWSLPFVVMLVAEGLSRLKPSVAGLAAAATALTWAAFSLIAQSRPIARRGPTFQEAMAVARCDGPVLVRDYRHAAVFAAFAPEPIEIALHDPAGRAPLGWFAETGLCSRSTGSCPGIQASCPPNP